MREEAVQKREMARKGKVSCKKLRRPKVSNVRNAGTAKTQFKLPVPIDASNAEDSL